MKISENCRYSIYIGLGVLLFYKLNLVEANYIDYFISSAMNNGLQEFT